VVLQCNKGLAGAPADEIAAAKDTATNPAVTESFALAITAAVGEPAYPGIRGHEPGEAAARKQAADVEASIDELRKPWCVSSYVWETDFFQHNWQESLLGRKLRAASRGQGQVRSRRPLLLDHGVGSEKWSADGFTRMN
jgi:hypothetical protein